MNASDPIPPPAEIRARGLSPSTRRVMVWFLITIVALSAVGLMAITRTCMAQKEHQRSPGIKVFSGEKIIRSPKGTLEDSEAFRTAVGLRVLQLMQSRSRGNGSIANEAVLDACLSRPKLWCWTVDADGNPLPAEAFSMKGPGESAKYSGHGGEIEIRVDESGEPRAFSFDFQHPGGRSGYSGPFIAQEAPGYSLLIPILYWMIYSPDQIPPDYATVMRDLRLKPIDGRVGQMLNADGPVEIYCHPTLKVLEARYWITSGPVTGPISYRLAADPLENSGYPRDWGDDGIVYGDVPSSDFVHAFTLNEDLLGPELPANALDPIIAQDLWREENYPMPR